MNMPHTFEANTPAKAAQVNANFVALKAAVNELQAGTCATGRTTIGNQCVENTFRAAVSWNAAVDACLDAGGALRSTPLLSKFCRASDSLMAASEWTADGLQETAAGRVAAQFFRNTRPGAMLLLLRVQRADDYDDELPLLLQPVMTISDRDEPSEW
ncbi:MAG: hypothetical protein ACT4TC_19055 [Myxococcaceae bacterium]